MTYSEEVKFGGGKVIQDGIGRAKPRGLEGAVDTVITNALIVDHSGIYKADVGLKDGRVAKIGKAGNPDTQPNVDIITGPGTEIIAGEGRILTAARVCSSCTRIGGHPAAIYNCFSVGGAMDVQVMIHTDTINESGIFAHTRSALKGRTIHAFHTEGAGVGMRRKSSGYAARPM